MRQVFVSHSSVDAEPAARLRAAILSTRPDDVVHVSSEREAGVGVGTWRPWIRNALSTSDVVVLVASDAALASPWVGAELGMALLLRLPIMALHVGDQPVVHPLVEHVNAYPLDDDALGRINELMEGVVSDPSPGVAGLPEDVDPYPGLDPLTGDMEAVFFGRTRERDQVLSSFGSGLHDAPMVVVSGPSGSGKSSIIRAGVIPRLRATGWHVVGPTQPRLVATPNGDGAPGPAHDASGLDPTTAAGSRTVVVLDQAEELVELDQPSRDRVIAWIDDAVSRGARVLIVVRTEFRAQVDLWSHTATDHYVPYMEAAALEEVVRGPARRVQLGIDDELVDRLVRETGSGAALPLLAFTLRRLWLARDRSDNELRASDLDELGGVQGVLRGQAERALAQASGGDPATAEEVLATLSRLASPTQNPPTRAPQPVLTLDHQQRDWMAAFVRVGLVSHRRSAALDDHLDTGVRPTGDDLVDVTHEALFSWQPLADMIDRQRERNRERARLLADAALWRDTGGDDEDLLATGDRLRLALDEGLGTRDDDVDAYLRASVRHDRGRRIVRLLTVSTAVAAVLAVVAAGFFLAQRNRATQARAEAETARDQAVVARQDAESSERLARSLRVAAQSRQAIDGQRDLALLAAVAAHEVDANPDTEGALSDALATPDGPVRWFARSGPDWSTLRLLAPDLGTVVSESRDPAVVELDDRTVQPRPVPAEDVPDGDRFEAEGVWPTADGRTVVTFGRVPPAGSAVGWVNVRADDVATLVAHARPVRAAVGTPEMLAFGDVDGAVLVASRDGEGVVSVSERDRHADSVTDLALSPDGRWLASASRSGVRVVALVDEADAVPVELASPGTDGRAAEQVVFAAADPPVLVAAGSDPALRVWQAGPDGFSEQRSPGEHGAEVLDLAADPNGDMVTSAARDGSVRQWSTNPLAPVGEALRSHRSPVVAVTSSGDGVLLTAARPVVAGDDPTAILWDLRPARTVEREGFVPEDWHQREFQALVAGDGPLAAITSEGELLVRGSPGFDAPRPARRAWWAADGSSVLVETSTNAQLDQPPHTLWRASPTGLEELASGLDALAVGPCLAAMARDTIVEFRDVGNCGPEPPPLELPGGAVVELALSSDEDGLLVVRTNTEGGGLQLEHRTVADGRLVRSTQFAGVTVTSAMWLDHDRVAVGSDLGGVSAVVDLASPGADSEGVPFGAHEDAVWWLAHDPGRQRLYSGGQDGLVSQTDLAGPSLVGSPLVGVRSTRLNDREAEVQGLRLDVGRHVLVALHGTRLVAWEVDPDRLAETACDAVDRTLTRSEALLLEVPAAAAPCS